MNKQTLYKVIEANDVLVLEMSVQAEISEGWVPLANVTVVHDPDSVVNPFKFYQAMIYGQ